MHVQHPGAEYRRIPATRFHAAPRRRPDAHDDLQLSLTTAYAA
jgi:hypothetical protein